MKGKDDVVIKQVLRLCFYTVLLVVLRLSCVVFIRMFSICNNKPEHVESG